MLCGEVDREDPECGCYILLILRANHKEDKLPFLRDDISALLGRDEGNSTGWNCLGYPVQFLVQSNNNIARPRLIYNMKFP
jgi:hypothetical protein